MKISDEKRKEAQALAKSLKMDAIFINDKGEFFTSENLAQLSVAGNKKKYQKLDFTSVAYAASADIFATIKALKTVEEVAELLVKEMETTANTEIMDACEARIEELKGGK